MSCEPSKGKWLPYDTVTPNTVDLQLKAEDTAEAPTCSVFYRA
jgi:hypothetical protein